MGFLTCIKELPNDATRFFDAISIPDRYLEHSRILYFHHGGDELVFISSADWMPRNLDRRAELLIPIEDPTSRDRLIEILKSYGRDNVKGRRLLWDRGYQRPDPSKTTNRYRHQQQLHDLTGEAECEAEQSRRTAIEPFRAPQHEVVHGKQPAFPRI